MDAQLRRLQTDYLDLLYVHWPERYVPLYGAGEYEYRLERRSVEGESASIAEQVEIMNDLIKAGMSAYICMHGCKFIYVD